jgi:branched-subunit amino acid transport protein
MNYPLIIFGMAVVTFGTRYLVLVYFSQKKMSENLKSALNFVPPVILISIIAPSLLLHDGSLNISTSNLPLIAGIFTSIIAIKTKNLLSTIVFGMLFLWGLQFISQSLNVL